MKRKNHRVGFILAALLAAGTPAFTQEAAPALGFGAAFKLRGAVGLSTSEDNLGRPLLGGAFEVTHDWTWGRLGLELGYQYKPGSQFMTDLSAMPVAPGMSVDPSQSVDSRKNRMDGILGRLTFERAIQGTDFAWRIGAQYGGTKFRQEYVGDVTDGKTYEDTYNGIVEKTGSQVSPLVGAAYRIDKEQALELNLLWLNYTSANYVHVAGTVPGGSGGNTAWDYVTTQKRSVPHLEFSYVLRF